MYKYWAFGLKVESVIDFPELFSYAFESPDITIELGKVPDNLRAPATIVYPNAQLNDTEYLFKVEDAATYYASNGNSIIVDPLPESHPRTVRLFLLATVMVAILHQRKKIPFHASAILKGGRLILFAGHSGSGKSTLLSGLMKKGYTIFSDDVVVLDEENDQITAIPSYPMIKLWDQAISYLNDPQFADKSFVVKPGMDKYGIFFHSRFDIQSYPIQKIVLLQISEDNGYKMGEVKGSAAFFELCKQVYRPHLLQGAQLLQQHFKQLTKLSIQTSVLQISRPREGGNPEELVNLVETIL